MRNRILKDISSYFMDTPAGPDIHTSNNSMGVTRVHWKNDISTLFFSNNSYGNLVGTAMVSGPCNRAILFLDRGFFGHSGWHKEKKDFDNFHYHLFNANSDLLPPEDLHCLLQNIKSFEKMNELCSDGIKDCLLSDDDFIKIQEEYNHYYLKEKTERETSPPSETDENQILDLGFSMLNSFIKTLIDKYLKPFLLDKASERGIPRNSVAPVLELLQILVITIFMGSPRQAVLNSTIVNIFRLLLIQSGIDSSMAETISAAIGNYFMTVRSYVSLINPARSQCIILGMGAAYALIRCLPKLKYEDPLHDSEYDKAEVISHIDPDKLPEGVTRRINS